MYSSAVFKFTTYHSEEREGERGELNQFNFSSSIFFVLFVFVFVSPS